ncbi:MAG TPA: outer membrane beta-barrel protein [Vicinamibacterales bacterium]|nr:outer membrane beta-barrel protein [Vicinamibacterales bacterium]
MHVRKMILGTVAALAIVAAVPAPASADWTFSPFIGSTFAGELNDVDLDESTQNKLSWGGSLMWMGEGIAGFEVDFGYTPEFFFSDNDNEVDFIGDGNVTTFMVNAVIGVPVGGDRGPGIRPYGTVGLGLVRQRVDDVIDVFDADRNSLGFNIGGGVLGMFTDTVGIRGDLRWFRQFSNDSDGLDDLDFDLSGLSFWRGTVGVTFRFGS